MHKKETRALVTRGALYQSLCFLPRTNFNFDWKSNFVRKEQQKDFFFLFHREWNLNFGGKVVLRLI